jgi:hypothetical protein
MCIFKKTPKQEALAWLKEDRDIHVSYLKKPEKLSTGTWSYHVMWSARFQVVIDYINGDPDIDREQCIGFIDDAQATHASQTSDAAWHYKWWQRYSKIKQYLLQPQ